MKQKTRLMTPEENHRFQLVQAVAFEVSIMKRRKRNLRQIWRQMKTAGKSGYFQKTNLCCTDAFFITNTVAASTAKRCCLGESEA